MRLPVIVLILILLALTAIPGGATADEPIAGTAPTHLDPRPDAATAAATGAPRAMSISFGTVYDGSIDQPAEEDDYLISPQAGDRILIRLRSSWRYNPQIKVLKPDGSKLQSGDGYGLAELQIVIPASGNYHILVGDTDGIDTGTYSLYLQRTNNPTGAISLASDQTIDASIGRTLEYDTYAITPTAGTQALLRMYSVWRYNPQMRLFKPDGSELKSSEGYNSDELLADAPVTGRYILLVGDSDGADTGSYSVYAHYITSSIPTPNPPIPAAYGTVYDGSIVHPAEEDNYLISPQAGDRILIRLRSSWRYNPQIRVLKPDGSTLQSSDGYNLAELQVIIPISGTYHVLVGDTDGADTGTYSLYMQRTNNPTGAISLASDQTIDASIGRTLEYDTYTVTPTAGTQTLLRMYSVWRYNPQMRLFKPDGSELKSSEGYNSDELTADVPITGAYTLLVGDSDGADTGSYSIYAHYITSSIPTPNPPIPAAYGTVYDGSIIHPAEEDNYLISPQAGDHILIRLRSSWRYNPQIRVLKPDGSTLQSSDGYNLAELQVIIPISGTYHVLVGDTDGADTGTYSLYLQRTNSPTGAVPLAAEETIDASIGRTLEYDTYTITPTGGTQILLRMNSVWRYNPQVRIFKPDGSELKSGDGYNSVELPADAPVTGRYTVLAGDSDGADTGTYSIYAHYVPASVLTVTSITPGTGNRGTTVAITDLAGTGFVSGATVKLQQSGSADIPATGVTVVSATRITCQFALPSTAATGAWNVVVTNPDSQSASLPGGFTVSGATATFRFAPTSLRVPIGGTSTTTLYLDGLATGLSGFNVTLALADPTAGEIVGVTLPGWAMTGSSTLPADTVWMKAADLNNIVQPGGNALIGTITVRGDRATQTELRVTQAAIEDENEHAVATTLAGCTVEVGSPVVMIPGGVGVPRDLNGDGLYEDVTGNGGLAFGDVILYFNQMDWIMANEPLAAFDYTRNGSIGFADIIWLFNQI